MTNDIFEILKKYNIRPSRQLGQNFLINEDVIDKIITASDLQKHDAVLEIGPGLGVLTKELVKHSGKVISIEFDKKIYTILKKEFKNTENLKIILGDILKFSNRELLEKLYDKKNSKAEYKLIANIPYHITSLILRKFTEQTPTPELSVLLIQKEVAQRITAKPGKLSILGVSVQLFCRAELIDIVPRSYFYPEPEVDSAIVKLQKHNLYLDLLNKENIPIKKFFQIIKIGFSSKRKKLYNNLSAGLQISSEHARQILKKAGVNKDARAQELSIEEWISVVKSERVKIIKF